MLDPYILYHNLYSGQCWCHTSCLGSLLGREKYNRLHRFHYTLIYEQEWKISFYCIPKIFFYSTRVLNYNNSKIVFILFIDIICNIWSTFKRLYVQISKDAQVSITYMFCTIVPNALSYPWSNKISYYVQIISPMKKYST